MESKRRPASFLLNDGSRFSGLCFGAERSVAGEAVFQTGMVGYTEAITDPSYEGQILVITYPLVGNYGVPGTEPDFSTLPLHFESNRIHVAGLIVADYTDNYSHWRAVESLSAWLKRENIPAIYGVDTREITKKIREKGVMLGKILVADESGQEADIDWHDPNADNLVAKVSTKVVKTYNPSPKFADDPNPVRILAVDVGMKYNQVRCFVNRGALLKVVPWDYDFSAEDYDGLFISNGPGDPVTCTPTIANIRKAIARSNRPIFGICLGHQLLSLAAGATTRKLKFGNRGHNIPCTDLRSGRCYITTQNHGYATDVTTLPAEWAPMFINANDGTNEGIMHTTKPFFSVQFHPESFPGPRDTEYLFDLFLDNVRASREAGRLVPLPPVKRVHAERQLVSKVLVLGSGGLSIGQAGEFDYSGSQCIKALKQEGITTVLINPNIATIQTSKGLADKVYFLPVTPEWVMKVIRHEKPDGILVTFGGQTALNCGIKIYEELDALGVKVLGTPIDTIVKTEDREIFAREMKSIGEPVAQSASAVNPEEALEIARRIGFPVIVRAAYALGGLGSGFAENAEQLNELTTKAFTTSPQVLVERSMKGWKEIEYEVVRDCHDNCITVCNMENFDPLGIHTGDSIVIAPSQTLSDREYHMLRSSAVKVIRHLGVVGECNIQFALNPDSEEYAIIEVNARLSRSSALASKATGYPLAFVAAKLSLNIPLTEIKNSVTRVTSACFEPSLDYCVVKIPRWDLKKFTRVGTKLSSSMKSVGEVMSIARTFEEALQKAIRAVDDSLPGFEAGVVGAFAQLDEELSNPSDRRLFAIADAFDKGYTVDRLHDLTKIDRWFLHKLAAISVLRRDISSYDSTKHPLPQGVPFVGSRALPEPVLLRAKRLGFSDAQIARLTGVSELAIRQARIEKGIIPSVKQIDTVAAEFPAQTNYLYMTYNASATDVLFEDKGIMVLGSGVYRIGSSVEFDWCAVSAVRTLRKHGLKTIMINYNPETVSTDYDEADRLYFENITLETVLDVYEREQSGGVIISMGGQVPNNIALPMMRQGVKILGTSPVQIDMAENRYKFSRLLDTLGVDQPKWKELTSLSEASEFCDRVSYPVLVRPSYVLSGAAMSVVYTADDLANYLGEAVAVSRECPVVISKYITEAKEIDVDAVAKDGRLVMHLISEHVENAGVHSGDATLVHPPQDLDPETITKLERATMKIAHALNVTGPFNIQFIAKDNDIKVIECNIRSSRSFPFVSKTSGVDMIEMATKAMLNIPFKAYPNAGHAPSTIVGVKVPQFSFSRLQGADPILGVEMASTGEVACFGATKYEAYVKALVATGFNLPRDRKSVVLSIGSYKEKQEFLPAVQKLHALGYKLYGTPGTADFYSEHDVPIIAIDFVGDNGEGNDVDSSGYSILTHLANKQIGLYVCLPSRNKYRRPASYMSRGYLTRRAAIDFQVPLVTNIKCAKLLIEAISRLPNWDDLPLTAADVKSSNKTVTLPGLVSIVVQAPIDIADGARVTAITKAAIAGGFTQVCLVPSLTPHSLTAAGLASVRESAAATAVCDFAIYAGSSDVLSSKSTQHFAGVFIDAAQSPSGISELAHLAHEFEHTPRHLPLVLRASDVRLASVLHLATVYERSIHVTQVSTKAELSLIRASKERRHRVTCDVSPLALFPATPTEDSQALWDGLKTIDAFATGIDHDLSGLTTALPLLLSAYHDGRLSIEDIVDKLHTQPARILRLPEQSETSVEIDLDRQWAHTLPAHAQVHISAHAQGKHGHGAVSRVVIRGKPAYIDGRAISESGVGHDIRALLPLAATAVVAEPLATAADARNVSSATAEDGLAVETDATPSGAIVHAHVERMLSIDDLSRDDSELAKSTLAAHSVLESAKIRHVLSVRSFGRRELHQLFQVATEMRTMVERMGSINVLGGKVMVSLFYEPSTRTNCSFQAAMLRLGGQVIDVDIKGSSVQKGETIHDTIRCVENYSDVIVMRHPEVGSVSEAASVSRVPVINAGDGIGEHPTQALLDLYTIREELGTVNGLVITLVGDLKHGRTTHSLVRLLAHYNVRLVYVSAPSLRMPEDIVRELSGLGIQQSEHATLDEVIADTDVLYVTRVQKERFASAEEYERMRGNFIVTPATLHNAKQKMIVMHPLPRVDEIDAEVDYDARAAYFRQMKYGLYVRMALLASILGRA